MLVGWFLFLAISGWLYCIRMIEVSKKLLVDRLSKQKSIVIFVSDKIASTFVWESRWDQILQLIFNTANTWSPYYIAMRLFISNWPDIRRKVLKDFVFWNYRLNLLWLFPVEVKIVAIFSVEERRRSLHWHMAAGFLRITSISDKIIILLSILSWLEIDITTTWILDFYFLRVYQLLILFVWLFVALFSKSTN